MIVRTRPQTSGLCPRLNYDHCYRKSSELMEEDCRKANAMRTLIDFAYAVGTVTDIAYAVGLMHEIAYTGNGTGPQYK
jgi:hypothetical protein